MSGRPQPGDPDFPYMLADTPEEFERVRRTAWPTLSPAAAGLPAEDVERVARALWEADNCLNPDADRDFLWALTDNHGLVDRYRSLAAAAIAAMPTSRAASTRAMRDVADNLDYYASKTAGGTHASGLEDAAAQIRAALAALRGDRAPLAEMQPPAAEEAVKRVEALARSLSAGGQVGGSSYIARATVVEQLLAALAPVPDDADGAGSAS